MQRMNGQRFGQWTLRLDAIYCAVLGTAVALAADQLAASIALPALVLRLSGVVVVVWALLVLWMVLKLRLRNALRLVLGVNVLAASLIALCVFTAGNLIAAVAVITIAIDVALFAVSQVVALSRLRTAALAG
ncbi:hypothetical protein [Leucobacter sp. 1207-22]|uniref:hypothetical protein n=1 Tax=Leucobacter sp. 1207-22 TaxID=2604456 RepID=UPI00406381FF